MVNDGSNSKLDPSPIDEAWGKSAALFIEYSIIGASVGLISSLLLFKSKYYILYLICAYPIFNKFIGNSWPVFLSTGFSLGMATAKSDQIFKSLSR